MSFGASTPIGPHTMLAEAIDITPPTYETLQPGSSTPVAVPKNVRTTFYTKTITVPVGQTEVFLAAYTHLDPHAPSATRTVYIAVDGADIANASSSLVYWLEVAGWTTLTPGTHTVTVAMLQNQDGKSASLSSDHALVMVCREPDSKYVSFSDTDVRTVLERANKVKVIVGIKGYAVGGDPITMDGYVKVIDDFGNEVDEEITGDFQTNPLLHEFAFVDGATVEVRSYSVTDAYWIEYLNIIYEV